MSSVTALARAMVNSHVAQRLVGRPCVCMNRGRLRHNRTLNERSQYCGRRAGDHRKTYATGRATAALDRDGVSRQQKLDIRVT